MQDNDILTDPKYFESDDQGDDLILTDPKYFDDSEPAEEKSAFTRGVSAGVDQVQALGGGLLALAGDKLGIDSVKDKGMEIHQVNQWEASENALDYGFTDIDGAGKAMEWAGYTLGNLAPTLATTVLGGGIGGLAAKGVTKKMVGNMVKREIAKGATKEQAQEIAGKALAKRITMANSIGVNTGAGAASVGMSAGGIYGDTGDADVALSHGLAAGALDALPITRVLKKFGGNEAAGKFKESILKEGAKSGLFEMGTEGAQSFIEQHARHWVETDGQSLLQNLDAVDRKELIDSMAAGGLGGAAMGIGGQALANVGRPKESEQTEPQAEGLPPVEPETPQQSEPLEIDQPSTGFQLSPEQARDFAQRDVPEPPVDRGSLDPAKDYGKDFNPNLDAQPKNQFELSPEQAQKVAQPKATKNELITFEDGNTATRNEIIEYAQDLKEEGYHDQAAQLLEFVKADNGDWEMSAQAQLPSTKIEESRDNGANFPLIDNNGRKNEELPQLPDAKQAENDQPNTPEPVANTSLDAPEPVANALPNTDSVVGDGGGIKKISPLTPLNNTPPSISKNANSEIDTAANEAATSPLNNLPEPTDAQKEANNYKLGRVEVQGLKIGIENPKGSTRSGTDSGGRKWESKIHHHYGDLTGTKGADGDAIDVFIGENPDSEKVFVVDQIDQKTGKFDEHKVMTGFDNKLKAVAAYKKNYEKGWKVGPVTEMPISDFKEWLKGDTTKPVAEIYEGKLKSAKPKPAKIDPVVTELGAGTTPNADLDHLKLAKERANSLAESHDKKRDLADLKEIESAVKGGQSIDEFIAAEAENDPDSEYEWLSLAKGYKFNSRGKPFKNEKQVPLSKAFKETPNASVVPVTGGYAVAPRADGTGNKSGNTKVLPGEFVISPVGGKDFGEISPEKAKSIGRQAGKIRLQKGEHVGPRKGYGLEHIEAGHPELGDIGSFVKMVADNYDKIYKAKQGRLKLVVSKNNDELLVVELKPGPHEDFYSVITAYKSRKTDGELLWAAAQSRPAESGDQPALSVKRPLSDAGRAAPSDKQTAKGKSTPTKKPVKKGKKSLFDDDSSPRFSRSSDNGVTSNSDIPSVSELDASRVVDGITARWKGGRSRVFLAPTYQDLPDEVKAIAKKYGAENDIDGIFHKDVNYVVLEDLKTAADVERVLLHEAYGHEGLKRLFGPELDAKMNQLFLAVGGSKGFNSLAKKHGINLTKYAKEYSAASKDGRMTTEARNSILMEELLAHIAQDSKPSLKRRAKEIIGMVRQWLRDHGFLKLAKVSDSEIFNLLKQARESVINGDKSTFVKPSGSSPRFSIRDDGTESIKPPHLEKWPERLLRTFQDKYVRLKNVQKSIEKRDGKLADEEDAYMAEELLHGKTENDLNNLENEHVKPLVDAMVKHDVTREELDLYLIAKHAKERNEYIASINDKMPDGGSGMKTQDALAILEKAKAEGKLKSLDDLANKVYSMTEARRTLLDESGLQDEQQTNAWRNQYDNYVPLKGFADNELSDNHPRVGKGFDVRGKESMKAMGRRTMAESPTLHVIQDLTESIIRNRKNEVGQTFLKMVENHADSELWEVFTDDNPDTHRSTVSTKNGDKVSETAVPMAIIKDKYLAVKRDGKVHYIKIKDQRLMEAMKNLGPEPMNGLTRFLGSITRWLSSVNTSLNPEFMVSNMSRDIQTAIYNALAEQDLHNGKVKGHKIAAKMAAGVPSTIRAIYRSESGKKPKGKKAEDLHKYYQEFLEDGAKTGYFDSKDIDQLAGDLSNMVDMARGGAKGNLLKFQKKTMDFIEKVNGSVENGVRLSAYMEAREAGVSRTKAASFAKTLTVNFNRKGTVGPVINSLYMFANASIQGTANFARAITTLKETDGKELPFIGNKRLNKAQMAAGAVMGANFALAMLNREMAGEDDDGVNWFDKIPNYVRERNFVLMKSVWGGKEGEYITIPMPYGYNIFANFGDTLEASINSTHKPRRENLAFDLFMSGVNSFSPLGAHGGDMGQSLILTATPTVLLPFVENEMNVNHFGGNIRKENYPFGAQKADSALAFRSTKQLYKYFSSWMNEISGGNDYQSGWFDVSPDTLEHLTEFGLGGIYRLGTRTLETVDALKDGRELEPRSVPFLRTVTGEILPYEDMSRFYDSRTKLDSIKALVKHGGIEEKREARQEHKEKLALVSLMKSSDKQMKALRKRRDLIESNDNLSDAEMDAQLKEVERLMKVIVDRFNQRWAATE